MKKWVQTVAEHLPCLSYSQAYVLGLWSLGMILARSCGLTRVSQQLATLLHQKEATVRQRLREWYWEKAAKTGRARQELDVPACFLPLLRWVLSNWPAQETRLALAMDASSLGDTFVVLSVSVVYRGCAIPVAWQVLRAAQAGAWKDEWLALLTALREAVPPDWQVLVLADRGLYADWLFRAIQELGWHPFLRINLGGKFRPQGSSQFLPLEQFLPWGKRTWAGAGTCFKNRSIQATLLIGWESGQIEPWLIVTDWPAEVACCAWYSLRAWIEQGFRVTKRGGWQWQHTRMTDPARATRFWLALTVATLWATSVGGEADAHLPVSSLAELPATHIARRKKKNGRQPRSLCCLQRGIALILVALIDHQSLPQGRFCPEPWPT